MELKNYVAQWAGEVLPGATCYLYQAGTETLASGLQDAAGAALANPFQASSEGLIQFAATNGEYDLRVMSGGRDSRMRVQCLDVAEQLAAAQAEADRAVAEADRASSDATRAELARDAAMANGNTYPDTASGLAAVADDEYFSVPSAESNEHLILYRKNAGAAQEISRYPSASLVSRLESGKFQSLGLQMSKMPSETGYAWALLDSAMRAALLVGLDGTVTAPKLNLQIPDEFIQRAQLAIDVSSQIAKPLNQESGFCWAVMDQAGRRALAIDNAGMVHGKFQFTLDAQNYLQSRPDLYFLGDSLTNGAGGQVTWREALPALISERQFTNIAIGGQTSQQIAARAGAYVTLLTLENNLIPGSGSVIVTERTISLLTSQGAQSIKGWLAGVYGTLVRNGTDDSYTFSRAVSGDPVPVGKNLAFSPDIGNQEFNTWLIFIGANNISQVDVIKRDIAACVDRIRTLDKRFLVMTPVTGSAANVNYCEQIEDWASQKYSDRVLKIREFSFQFNDGTADDLADVTNGIIPRSLRIDTIHFTTAFHAQIAALVASEINRRGW